MAVRDEFDFLVQLNQAQLVTLSEAGLLSRSLVKSLAVAINSVSQDSLQPHAPRPTDYLAFEQELITRVGAAASNLHIGRSRNDIGATRERLLLRQDVLRVLKNFIAARDALLSLASAHVHTVIPAYTHGVQAQPTTLAHYLLALASTFERDFERLTAAYRRINQSPLGAAALSTSGFPLNRKRLAALLGFEELCENSYDGIGVASADSKAELACVLAVSALAIGRFCQDLIHIQSDPVPGLSLDDSLLGGSSIMPQKRNPGPLEQLRALSSTLVGDTVTVLFIVHNTPFGDVADVRGEALARTLQVTDQAYRMFDLLGHIVARLVVLPEYLQKKVEQDFSTMTELADILFRDGDVPFRLAHEVASQVATYGRAEGKVPAQIPFSKVAEIYQRVTGNEIPIDADQLTKAVDPAHFVVSRRGQGGPQPNEVKRMLTTHRQRLTAATEWFRTEQERITVAEERLKQGVLSIS